MANNYTETSAFLDIPEDKRERAEAVLAEARKLVEDDDPDMPGWCECETELEKSGIWFYSYESVNPDHAEVIARHVIETLEIDEPFYMAWSHTCSKPRIDEFGGGAFVVMRGEPTFWVDAMYAVREHVRMVTEARK